MRSLLIRFLPMMLPSTSTMTVSPQKTYLPADSYQPPSFLTAPESISWRTNSLPHIQKNITPAIRAPIGQRYMEHTSIQSDTIPSMHRATTGADSGHCRHGFLSRKAELSLESFYRRLKEVHQRGKACKSHSDKKYRHHYSSSRHLGEHIRQVYEHPAPDRRRRETGLQ